MNGWGAGTSPRPRPERVNECDGKGTSAGVEAPAARSVGSGGPRVIWKSEGLVPSRKVRVEQKSLQFAMGRGVLDTGTVKNF